MDDTTFRKTARPLKPLLFSLSLWLGACQTVPPGPDSNVKVDEIVIGIKKDLAHYEREAGRALARSVNETRCADLAGFVITKVAVSLVVNTKTTAGASGELTVPAFQAGTIGPAFSTSTERAGTQTMTFSLYPFPKGTNGERDLVAGDPDAFPISTNLQALTEGLVNANETRPCLSLVPLLPNGQPDKDKDKDGGSDTFAYGFTLTKTDNASANVKFVLFALGASRANERKVGNTITVTFKAVTKDAAAEYLRSMR